MYRRSQPTTKLWKKSTSHVRGHSFYVRMTDDGWRTNTTTIYLSHKLHWQGQAELNQNRPTADLDRLKIGRLGHYHLQTSTAQAILTFKYENLRYMYMWLLAVTLCWCFSRTPRTLGLLLSIDIYGVMRVNGKTNVDLKRLFVNQNGRKCDVCVSYNCGIYLATSLAITTT